MENALNAVYQEYAVTSFMQLHMRRVAGIASLLCDHMPAGSVDKESIVTAALLHDIGNVVREPNPSLAGLYEPEGFAYREPKHNAMRERYGTNDHAATHAIVQELGCSQKIHTLIDAIDVLKAGTRDDDLEAMVLYYADNRVAPHGIVSLEQRFTDAAARGAHRVHHLTLEEALKNVTHEAEIVFKYCTLKQQEITDEFIKSQM